jgi:hypothetical protein
VYFVNNVPYFHDYALKWWVTNNYLKPDTAQNYHYTGDIDDYMAYPNNSRFYYNNILKPNDDRDLRFDNERYEIFAFCAESRSRALGAVEKIGLFKDETERSKKDFNLGEKGLKYDKEHYSHSRQFRSDIVSEWSYWSKFYTDCSLKK